jgi:hypothetical protein
VAAIATAFWTPFQIAFATGSSESASTSSSSSSSTWMAAETDVVDEEETAAVEDADGASTNFGSQFEMFLTMIFIIDIVIQFHLARSGDNNDSGVVVTSTLRRRLRVRRHDPNSSMADDDHDDDGQRDKSSCHPYLSSPRFWCDLLGVLPLEQTILLAWSLLRRGHDDENNGDHDHQDDRKMALGVSLVRLVRFVRLYRLQKLSDLIQYNGRIKLLWSTLLRNIAVILFSTFFFLLSFDLFVAVAVGWVGQKLSRVPKKR